MTEPNEKIIERIRKLFAVAEGVANDSNSDEIKESIANEAMSAAKMAESLLFKYKLSKADVVLPEEEIEEIIPVFGFTIVPDFLKRANASRASYRKVWFEELAKVVAEGYFCKSAPRPDTREVIFYGLDMDREIAIYVFQRLAETAHELGKIEWKKAQRAAGTVNFETLEEIPYVEEEVFLHNFHVGFRASIQQSYLDRLNEEDEHSQEIFRKAQDETMVYFSSVRDRTLEGQYNKSLKVDIEENLWSIAVGKKAGNRASTRINTIAGDKNAIEKANSVLNESNGIVWLLLDRSGSMYGDKLSQAKSGAVDYATQANQKGYSVGVIQFDWTANVVVDPQKEINISWHNAVSKIKSGGSTNLTDAIKQAKARFPSARVKRIICIVTDGEPDNRETALEAATECKKSGIELFAIGTDDADKDFLDKLTDMKGIKVTRGELRGAISDMAKMLPAGR